MSSLTIVKVMSGSLYEQIPDPTGGIEIAELASAQAVAEHLPHAVSHVHIICHRGRYPEGTQALGDRVTVHRLGNGLRPEESNSATFSENFGRRAAALALDLLAGAPAVVEHTAAIPAAVFGDALDRVAPRRRSSILFAYSAHNSLFLTDEPKYIFADRRAEWSAWRSAEFRAVHHADVVICPSAKYLDFVQRYTGIPREKCEVVANTVGPVRLTDDPPGDWLLYIGRLADEKRLDTLLRAFARVRASEPGATLVVCGDGPRRESLHEFAAQLDLEVSTEWPPADGRVTFAGVVHGARKEAAWRGARAHCCFSESEVSPVVGYEALRYGVPSVVSDLPSWRELVDDSRTGYVVPVGGWLAAAEGMARLIRDQPLAGQMSLASRATYEARYAPAVVAAQRYKGVYERVHTGPEGRLRSAV